MSDDPLWVAYEPQPPRIYAIVVTDSNFDEVAAFFDQAWLEGVSACAKHWNREAGRFLALTFRDPDGKPYELMVKPWQVLVQPVATADPYEVVDYQEFRHTWRERLSK